MGLSKYITQISEYLYDYIEGDSTDLPRDEYYPEAHTLVELLEGGKVQNTPEEISKALTRIFDDSFEESHDKDAFTKAGEDIYELVINNK